MADEVADLKVDIANLTTERTKLKADLIDGEAAIYEAEKRSSLSRRGERTSNRRNNDLPSDNDGPKTVVTRPTPRKEPEYDRARVLREG